ncbi:glycosyltransferase family 2 protein [Actibacterium pelagium]|uniref:Glycosyl transferase family 2 n=1 Tax=Actibacterium pelagium TaxID=2029103 RepID=A0A917ADP1_9RHOB|nr:glycosyltransferase family 2 protein [Actibacterium pelagium]GGE45379.1 hypothetical protein GCM10011517_11220 [Actibacterium pelagium]
MASDVAVLTMVRDDDFFLEKWVDYYGGLFGRSNLYVINHGYEASVDRIAEGCNIIGLPGDPHKGFDNKRWRLLSGLTNGIRTYYRHIIVGDVDEFVIVDPDVSPSLKEFLAQTPTGQVLTPFGLDVMHRRKDEPEAISQERIIGPRRFVRKSVFYSKPCVLSGGAKIARGGHYTDFDKLNVPEGLYMLHLKHCDFDLYQDTLDRRNKVVDDVRGNKPNRPVMMGAHWYRENRNDDEIFAKFEEMPVADGFDFSPEIKGMYESWQPRGNTPLWEFGKFKNDVLNELPERFFGII